MLTALKDWAQTNDHLAKVREAERIIAWVARNKELKPYLAFSGGKDSTCLLHLVLQVIPEVMVLHWDYGPYYIPRSLAQEFIENARRLGAKNLRIETSPEYDRLERQAINVLGREYLGKLIPRLRKEGYNTVFLGLRAEESVKRRLKTKDVFWREKYMLNLAPIKNWSWRDVWAYIFSRGLPYASIYDLYGPVIGWENARLVTFFDPEFDKFGGSNMDSALMWRFKHAPGRRADSGKS